MSKDSPPGSDFSLGVPVDQLQDGVPLLGHVGKEAVLLVRRGQEYFATGAVCTHYHGPLEQGLVVGDTIRCPWHHACFSLRSGEVLAAPALAPLPTWKVELKGGRIQVTEKQPLVKQTTRRRPAAVAPSSVVIVGGGAAGEAAASALRFSGYQGPVTILSAEDSLPPDRPNLSKDFLAGTAPVEWVPVRAESYYQKHDIRLIRNAAVMAIDTAAGAVVTADGARHHYAALLLATGAAPIRLRVPGADSPKMHYFRGVADSEAIIGKIKAGARRAVIVGASFIGLEVAASLRIRGLEVHVVAPESRPLERIFGPDVGDFVRSLHESKGVQFHLQQTVSAIDGDNVRLSEGSAVATDLVVVGIGVTPQTALAEQAGLKTDRGVLVNEYLQTSIQNIYAAGDIARWPDPNSGGLLRVEHWAVAQRQGQTAARNILGYRERYAAVPFFWSQHYDVSINYIGHAQTWDELEIDGSLKDRNCAIRYKLDGRLLALATVFRDRDSLLAEAAMERRVGEL